MFAVTAIILFAMALVVVGSLLWWLSGWYALPEGQAQKTLATAQREGDTWSTESAQRASAMVTLVSRGHEAPTFTPAGTVVAPQQSSVLEVTAEYIELGPQFKLLGFTKLWRIRQISVGSANSIAKETDPWWYFAYLNNGKLRSMIQYVTVQKATYEQPAESQTYVIQATETGLIIKPE